MAAVERELSGMLLAGTAAGQLLLLDLTRGEAATQLLCTPPGLAQVDTRPIYPGADVVDVCCSWLIHRSWLCSKHLSHLSFSALQYVTAVAAQAQDQQSSSGGATLLVAGLQGGQAAVLDARGGQLIAYWPAHSATISGALCWEHYMVTASQVPGLRPILQSRVKLAMAC